jgi:hypothetical protein
MRNPHRIEPNDLERLKRLKANAPCTWRATSDYFAIAAKYGYVPEDFTDDLPIHLFVDAEIEAAEQDATIPHALEALPFPVRCSYPQCDQGPFHNAIEVDEHITAEHLAEAVWTFAYENMRPASEPCGVTLAAGSDNPAWCTRPKGHAGNHRDRSRFRSSQ